MDLALKIVAVVSTIVGGIYQWRRFRFRSELKSDLEILKLYEVYGRETREYRALKQHIDETIIKAYPTEDDRLRRSAGRELLFLFACAGAWGFLIARGNTSWLAFFAFVFCFVAMCNRLMTYLKDQTPKR